MTLLINGGTVVGPTGAHRRRRAGRRRDDRRAARARARRPADGDETIDATGKYVIPGGIDAHTHMELPFGGTVRLATRSTPAPGRRRSAAPPRSSTSPCSAPARSCRTGWPPGTPRPTATATSTTRFHMILGGVDDDALKAMDQLVADEGITSFKLFMAYPGVFYSDDGQILRAMQKARDNGAMIMMHAENGIAIDVLVQQALARGETDPIYHGLTRPPALEARGDQPGDRAGRGRAGLPALHRAPVRQPRRSSEVAAARDAGRNVFAETCPQYLYLTLEDQLGAPGFEGAKWVCSTPLRSKHEPHQRDLWKGLRTNDLGDRVDRPLPVLHEGPEGARARRLLQDPERHRRRRAPRRPALPGRGRRQAVAGALGGDDRDHAGPDVRPLPAQGRSSRPAPTPTSWSTTRTGRTTDQRRDPPHEHGPLGVGGLRDRRQGRHGHLPRRGHRRPTATTTAARAAASTCAAA